MNAIMYTACGVYMFKAQNKRGSKDGVRLISRLKIYV